MGISFFIIKYQDIHGNSGEKFMIYEQKLYNRVTNKQYGEHTIEIDVKGEGFKSTHLDLVNIKKIL